MAQVMAFSATFTPELLSDLEPLVKRPQRVMLCDSPERVSLKGVRQFYALLQPGGQEGQGQREEVGQPQLQGQRQRQRAGEGAGAGGEGAAGESFELKVSSLLRLLGGTAFHQAAVFCNNKPQVGGG